MRNPNRRHRRDRLDLDQIGDSGVVGALAAPNFAVADLHAATHAAEVAGYRSSVISPAKLLVGGRSPSNEEMNFVVDCAPIDADPASLDGLIVPGGREHVARLGEHAGAKHLVQALAASGKPVVAFGEAIPFVADAIGVDPVDADAAVALRGQLFAAAGEDARAEAAATFVKAMEAVAEAA